MIVSLTCLYCDHKWERYVPKKSEMTQPYCTKCGDDTIRIRDTEISKIDYYAGAPKFPSSPLTEELLDYMLIGTVD